MLIFGVFGENPPHYERSHAISIDMPPEIASSRRALLVLARTDILRLFREERPTPGGRPEWVAGRRIERS